MLLLEGVALHFCLVQRHNYPDAASGPINLALIPLRPAAHPGRDEINVDIKKIQEIDEMGKKIAAIFERMFACLELSDDMFCRANQDGYFEWVNSAWERVLGWTKEELCSSPWLTFVHRDDVEKTIAAAEMMNTEGLAKFENRYRSREGSYRKLRWKTLKWNSGTAYCMAKDITEAIG